MPDQKALYLPEKQAPFVVMSTPIYKPGPGDVLIKVESAGLAPADWIIQVMGVLVDKYPAILGVDTTGTVEEVGEGVTRFTKGDRVLKECSDREAFAGFQQYTLSHEDTTAKIPNNMSFDQAATIPLALGTSAVALYHDGVEAIGGTCGLTPPWEDGGRGKYLGQPTVIFSGASTVGQINIQLLKLSGFSPIITTASLKNAAFLETLGATHVLDRNLPAEALHTAVRTITQAPIKVVYDVAGTHETRDLGYALLAPGGVLATVQPEPIAPEKQVPGKTAFFVFGDVNIPQNRKLGASLYAKLTGLLEEGALKPIPVEVVPGGLEGIPAGLEKLRKGVSCVKLVAHPQETA